MSQEVSTLAQSKILNHLRRNRNGLSMTEFNDFLRDMDEINVNLKNNLGLLHQRIRNLLFCRNGKLYANMYAKVSRQNDIECQKVPSHSLGNSDLPQRSSSFRGYEDERSAPSSNSKLRDVPKSKKMKLKIDEELIKNLERLIGEYPNGILLSEFCETYEKKYKNQLDVKELGFFDLLQFVIHNQSIFRITKIQVEGDFLLRDAKKYPEDTKRVPEELKRQIINIMDFYTVLYIENLEKEYQKKYGKKLVAADYDFLHIDDLIWHMRDIIKFGVSNGRVVLYFDKFQYKQEVGNPSRNVSMTHDIAPLRLCNREFIMKAQLLPRDHTMNSTIPVRISRIVTPSIHYVQLSEHYGRLHRLMLEMNECYNEIEHTEQGKNYAIKKEDLLAGMFCVCMHKKRWHRACIVSADNPDRINVKLVDYGTFGCVELKHVKYLFYNFADLPAQSICILEVGLSVYEDVDSDTVCEIMKELSKRNLLMDLLEYTPVENFDWRNQNPILKCHLIRECNSARISTIISRLVFNNFPHETNVQHASDMDHRYHNIMAPTTTYGGVAGVLNNHNLERGGTIHPIYITHSVPIHEPYAVPSQTFSYPTPYPVSSSYMPYAYSHRTQEGFHLPHSEHTSEYILPLTANNVMLQRQFNRDFHVEQSLYSGQPALPLDHFLDYPPSYIHETINSGNDRMLRLDAHRVPMEMNDAPFSRHGYVYSSNVPNYIDDEVLNDNGVVSRNMNIPKQSTQRNALISESVPQSRRRSSHEINLIHTDRSSRSEEQVRLTDERSEMSQSNIVAHNPCSSNMLDEMMALRISQDCPQMKTKELLRKLRNSVDSLSLDVNHLT